MYIFLHFYKPSETTTKHWQPWLTPPFNFLKTSNCTDGMSNEKKKKIM